MAGNESPPQSIVDELCLYIKDEKVINTLHELYNDYHSDFEKMIENVLNDPEEADLIRWHIKHFRVHWFLETWKYISSLDENDIDKIIELGYMNYFGENLNWTLMSRKFNPDDKLFCKYFGDRIDKKFMYEYNPKYNSKYMKDVTT